MKDALGDRIKENYESRTRHMLPRRTYTIIRVDGKAFHTLTKNFIKPFDQRLMNMMDSTAKALCKEIQGAKFAYVQSDEISILVTDFDSVATNMWFDGNVQKICSISAACASVEFNKAWMTGWPDNNVKTAMFDSRVFTIPDPVEVENYFIWRQNDASRNSVQMVARSLYSHKELEGKGIPELHDMIHAKGKNWNDYLSGEKRGRCIVKVEINQSSEYAGRLPGQASPPEDIVRKHWVSMTGQEGEHMYKNYNTGIPIFTQDREFLRGLIPAMPSFTPKESE